jgi:hypothetical protein
VTPTHTVRSRPIAPEDLEALAQLLPRGFPDRSSDYFRSIFARLAAHRTPPGFPKYGYLMESDGQPVGAILMIFSSLVVGGQTRVRGNGAFWYVEPEFRSLASMLFSRACSHKDVTYLNLSPGLQTLGILDAQRFAPYITGEFKALPALRLKAMGAEVHALSAHHSNVEGLTAFEAELLRDHLDFGCIALICRAKGEAHPFVFEQRRRPGIVKITYARLVYCRSLEDFVRCAGPVGRFLTLRGMPIVCIDANGPVPGLIGKFFKAATPKYFKGPYAPTLGDFAYTERVMFGN